MKCFQTTLLAAIVALSMGCGADASDSDPKPPREIPEGTGTSTNFLTITAFDGTTEHIYVNGANVAWISFAKDFGTGSFDETRARQIMDDVVAKGGNTIRWWVHTNGSQTPSRDVSGVIEADQSATIDDMIKVLQIAEDKGLRVMFSLWSFDMLAATQGDMTTTILDSNYDLLTNQAVRQAYITNFIIPLVAAIENNVTNPGAFDGLLALEIFNEPENMTEPWFRNQHGLGNNYPVTEADIRTTTAELTAAIHNASTKGILVTTGPKSLGLFNNNTQLNDGGVNAYSDANMESYLDPSYSGDVAKAHLDFYAPHYYDDMGKKGAWSPFYHKASYWELDKPIILGEFFADKTAEKPAEFDYFNDPISEAELCGRLVSNKYAGGLSWQVYDYETSVLNCVKNATDALNDTNTPPSDPNSVSYNFEDGLFTEFDTASDTGATMSLRVDTSDPHAGSNALGLTYSAGAGEKKVALMLPTDAVPVINEVSAWIKLPTGANAIGIGGGEFFAKVGDGWTWASGGWESLTDDTWTEVTWRLSTPVTASDLHEFGFQIYGNNDDNAGGPQYGPSNATVLFDNIVIK